MGGRTYLHDGRPEVNRLEADGAIPHPLEPALGGGALGGGGLPPAASPLLPAEGAAEGSRAGEGLAGLGGGRCGGEERPGGAEEGVGGGGGHCGGRYFSFWCFGVWKEGGGGNLGKREGDIVWSGVWRVSSWVLGFWVFGRGVEVRDYSLGQSESDSKALKLTLSLTLSLNGCSKTSGKSWGGKLRAGDKKCDARSTRSRPFLLFGLIG